MKSSNTIRFAMTLSLIATGFLSAAEANKAKANEQTKAQVKQVNEACKNVQQGSPQQTSCVQQVQAINKQQAQRQKAGGSK